MKEELKEMKQTTLANNCPECYSNDTLQLTFYQKYLNNSFFKKTTGEITNTMICKKCNSNIYPVQWTEDIERVYDFYLKSLNPNKTSSKLTSLSITIIVILLILIPLMLYLVYRNNML